MATLSAPPSEPREQPLRSTAFGGIFGWGAVLLLLVGIIAYVLIVWLGVGTFTDADAARVLERQKILQDIQTADYKYLHDAPSYFKKDAGLIRVPIDRAMALTLADLQKIEPHAAYPIAQSPPQNSAAPTSPDKGAGQAGKTNGNNPPASNPTVGQAVPAPSATTVPPTPTPVAANTPSTSAGPAATNNANNPGNPPSPGTQAQPSAAPMETNTSGVVTPTPVPAAPSATPAATASPANAPGSTPTPNPQEPGASPAGTP